MTDSKQGVIENRALKSGIKNEEINATALWHMLTYGFARDLRELKEEIASRPAAEKIKLLAAKDADFPGLFRAFQEGHADAIKAFGDLLQLVQPEQRVKLLAAKDSRNIPGLFMALKNGHVNAIKSFGDLLHLVPSGQRAELLAAKYGDFPGLLAALGGGHAGALKAFGDLLSLAPHGQRAQLLMLETEGVSGLAEILKEDEPEALEKYMEIVKKIAPTLSIEERIALLKYIQESHAERIQGKWSNFPYYDALKDKNADFYLKFEEMKNALLRLIPPEQRV